MADLLSIENLEFWTRIGASDGERSAEQRLLVSVALDIDVKSASRTDDLLQTIDYEAVKEAILLLRTGERHIIEHLAEDIAAMILRKFAPGRMTVTVTKFPLPGVRSVSITITRP